MRTIKNWRGEPVECYQDADLEELMEFFYEAEHLWIDEWRRQGSTDEGSSTGGKGIRVNYVAPRARTINLKTVVRAPGVQGNLSAARSAYIAMDYLLDQGVTNPTYYDGWMD